MLFYLISHIYVYITVDREKATAENAAITKNIVGMNFRICYYKKKQTGTANSAGTRTCFFETGQVAGCFFLQTLIFEIFIRSQERSSTSWHTTSSWILTKEIVNRYLMSHNKIYLWRKKILVTNNSWYRNCSFLLPYFNRYCLSECACLDLLFVMAYPCYTDQTYHRTLFGPYIPRKNGSLSHTTGYKPN